MLTLIIRAILIYLLVLAVFRLMGKRQLGQMQPFELVLTLIIADLATIPMAESSIPTLHGIVPLITLVVVHFALSILSKKSILISKIISGKPVIIINPDGVDFDALNKLDISLEDVFESIRGAGFFKLEDVQYAIMETNGTVNVLPKSGAAPATNNDLKINAEEPNIPVTLISEGRFVYENLKLLKVKEDFVINLIKQNNAKKLKDVMVLTMDKNGNCYFQQKNSSFITFSANFQLKELAQ